MSQPATSDPDNPVVPSFQFDIGDRKYFVTRDSRRGNGWCIISRGDLVEYVSSNHWGDVAAFVEIAGRLKAIEEAWANRMATPASAGPANFGAINFNARGQATSP